jgi:hypothetical protein
LFYNLYCNVIDVERPVIDLALTYLSAPLIAGPSIPFTSVIPTVSNILFIFKETDNPSVKPTEPKKLKYANPGCTRSLESKANDLDVPKIAKPNACCLLFPKTYFGEIL